MQSTTRTEQEEERGKFHKIGTVRLYIDDLENIDHFLKQNTESVAWRADSKARKFDDGSIGLSESLKLDTIEDIKLLRPKTRNSVRVKTGDPEISIHLSRHGATIETNDKSEHARRITTGCRELVTSRQRKLDPFIRFSPAIAIFLVASLPVSLAATLLGIDFQSPGHLRNLITLPLLTSGFIYLLAVTLNINFGSATLLPKRIDESTSQKIKVAIIGLVVDDLYTALHWTIERVSGILFFDHPKKRDTQTHYRTNPQ